MKLSNNFLTYCTFFGLISILPVACRVTGEEVSKDAKNTQRRIDTSSKDTISGTADEGTTPQIIFLTYSIKKLTENAGYSLQLIDEIITEGKIKFDNNNFYPQVGDLRCVALDANQQPVTNTVIPDPLNEIVEYVSEEGNLAKKEITLDSTQFSLRMQLLPSAKFIAIERIDTPDGQSSRLILTQIN